MYVYMRVSLRNVYMHECAVFVISGCRPSYCMLMEKMDTETAIFALCIILHGAFGTSLLMDWVELETLREYMQLCVILFMIQY